MGVVFEFCLCCRRRSFFLSVPLWSFVESFVWTGSRRRSNTTPANSGDHVPGGGGDDRRKTSGLVRVSKAARPEIVTAEDRDEMWGHSQSAILSDE